MTVIVASDEEEWKTKQGGYAGRQRWQACAHQNGKHFNNNFKDEKEKEEAGWGKIATIKCRKYLLQQFHYCVVITV